MISPATKQRAVRKRIATTCRNSTPAGMDAVTGPIRANSPPTAFATSNYGQPTQQSGTAYKPLTGQLGFRMSF